MLGPVRHFAVAAIGRDRPGIVAAVTHNLLDHELNVEDSQMTILGGHFTTMMIVSRRRRGRPGRAARRPRAPPARELNLEAISVDEVADAAHTMSVPTHIVTVYGVDHPGIVHAVSAALAQLRGQHHRPQHAAGRRRGERRPAPTATAARTSTR